MRLSGIRSGDIIRAGGMHAVVIRKDRRALVVSLLTGAGTRRIHADEIEAHWRRAGISATRWRIPPSPRRPDPIQD